jgi:hypothetical protein
VRSDGATGAWEAPAAASQAKPRPSPGSHTRLLDRPLRSKGIPGAAFHASRTSLGSSSTPKGLSLLAKWMSVGMPFTVAMIEKQKP